MRRRAAKQGGRVLGTGSWLAATAGTSSQKPPKNSGTAKAGSPTVRVNGKPAARLGDPVETCNDPADRIAGQVVAAGSVRIG